MAYDRQTFKNRAMEKIDGALLEFYKARLAELNGQTKWIKHWKGEVERLVYLELQAIVLRPIKGYWDRRKAVNEVVAELRTADFGYRRVAENTFKRYYGLSKIRQKLPPEVTDEFYGMVTAAVDETLESERSI